MTEPPPDPPGALARRRALLALLLLVPIPSIGTAMGMIVAPGRWWGQAPFAASKVGIVLLPLAWIVLVEKRRPRVPRPSARGMGPACLTGTAIVACIAGVYWGFARERMDLDAMRTHIHHIGLGEPVFYLLGAFYWCTLNSILEEYVWRWFVFTRCEALLPRAAAVIASGLLFTVHHVVALSVFLPWHLNLLASLGVFAGGAIWSWLYLTSRNIYAPYVSHVFADIIIFGIGYQIAFGG